MKLYRIDSGERDWFAANSEAEALAAYRKEYGLSDRDMDGVEICEADPDAVEVYPDDWNDESEDDPPTAAEVMATMKKPGLVCSTHH